MVTSSSLAIAAALALALGFVSSLHAAPPVTKAAAVPLQVADATGKVLGRLAYVPGGNYVC